MLRIAIIIPGAALRHKRLTPITPSYGELYLDRPECLVGPQNHPGNLDHLLTLVAR